MILVIAEHADNKLKAITAEALTFARRAAADFGYSVRIAVLGDGVSAVVDEIRTQAVESILVVDHPALAGCAADAMIPALEALVRAENPFLVVAAHSSQGVDVMPRLAVRLQKPLVSGCVDYEKQGDRLVLTRPVFNGKINMRTIPRGSGPLLATVSPGAFAASGEPGTGTPEIRAVDLDLSRVSLRTKQLSRSEAPKGEVDLASAAIIVAGGRGLKQKENFSLIADLANALGGAVAASRPVVDAEWLPREYQVGSSGQTVAPKLYFAIGISGAVQHLVGMQSSRCIVAINKDPEAPIFKVAHYGIVDDLFKVVPALTKLVRDLKGI